MGGELDPGSIGDTDFGAWERAEAFERVEKTVAPEISELATRESLKARIESMRITAAGLHDQERARQLYAEANFLEGEMNTIRLTPTQE